jgi:hypothetical protein
MFSRLRESFLLVREAAAACHAKSAALIAAATRPRLHRRPKKSPDNYVRGLVMDQAAGTRDYSSVPKL